MRCGRTRGAGAFILHLLVLLALLLGSPNPLWADADIARAQRQLLERGFDPGPLDGLMGPRTRSAIGAFQRDRGLPASGRLDGATLEALAAPGETAAPAPREAETVKQPAPREAETVEQPAAREPPAESAAAPRPAGHGKLLDYQTLGWEPPQGGPDALNRFRKNAGSPEMTRSTEDLIVPRGDGVYVVAPGERIPGFDCDPSKGRIEMELMLDVGGPVMFRALDAQGYCKLGFGILLEVGQRIRILEAAWGDETIPAGIVEVAPEGLRYVSMN